METKIIYEKEFYVDHISISFNETKISLDMHSINPIADVANNQAVQSLVVRHNVATVSPLLAKDLLNTLKKTIDDYESKFGKIKMPNNLKAEKQKKEASTYFG